MALCKVAMNENAPLANNMAQGSGLQDKQLDAGGILSTVCGMCLGKNNDIPLLSCLKAILCPCWVVNDSYTREDKCLPFGNCCDGVAPQCCCAVIEPAVTPGFMTSELYHLNAYKKDNCCAFTCAFCCSTCLMESHNNNRSEPVSTQPGGVITRARLQQSPSAETKPFKW